MNRPVYLREETWCFLRQALDRLSNAQLLNALSDLGFEPRSEERDALEDVVVRNPGPFLAWAGIGVKPALLNATVVADGDGVEYLICHEGSWVPGSRSTATVRTKRLYDGKEVVRPLEEVLEMARNNGVFDQLDRPGLPDDAVA